MLQIRPQVQQTGSGLREELFALRAGPPSGKHNIFRSDQINKEMRLEGKATAFRASPPSGKITNSSSSSSLDDTRNYDS